MNDRISNCRTGSRRPPADAGCGDVRRRDGRRRSADRPATNGAARLFVSGPARRPRCWDIRREAGREKAPPWRPCCETSAGMPMAIRPRALGKRSCSRRAAASSTTRAANPPSGALCERSRSTPGGSPSARRTRCGTTVRSLCERSRSASGGSLRHEGTRSPWWFDPDGRVSAPPTRCGRQHERTAMARLSAATAQRRPARTSDLEVGAMAMDVSIDRDGSTKSEANLEVRAMAMDVSIDATAQGRRSEPRGLRDGHGRVDRSRRFHEEAKRTWRSARWHRRVLRSRRFHDNAKRTCRSAPQRRTWPFATQARTRRRFTR